MDGWITIGTDVDSKKFEKELNHLKRESEKFEKEEERLLNKKAKLELDVSKSDRDLDNLNDKIEKTYKKLENEKSKLSNIPQWKQDSPEYSKQSGQVDKVESSYNTLLVKHADILQKQNLQRSNLDSINQKLIENATNQENVNKEMLKAELQGNKINLNTNNIGSSIKDNIKKAGRWVLAIFSIRSAYMAVRQSMATISQYNDSLNNKLYSIKMVFASALEPIVKSIVNLVYKLLVYINYISKAWFGVDLFAKANENSLKSSNKEAKKLKKTLAGFDEMNVLNENGSTGAGGSSNSPKFEMPKDIPIPSWVQWIADNKDKVIGFFVTLGAIIAGIKIATFLSKLGALGKGLSGLVDSGGKAIFTLEGFGKLLSGTMIIGGLVLIATHVFNLIKNWNEMSPAERAAEIALVALGVAFVALGLVIRGAIDTATLGIGEIIALGVAILALKAALIAQIASLVLAEGSIKSVKKANEDLKTAQEELKQATDDYSTSLDTYDNALKRVKESAKKLEEVEKKNKISGEELQKQVDNGKISYDTMTTSQKEVYKAYIDNIQAEQNLSKATEDLKNNTSKVTEAKQKEKIASWESKLAVSAEKGEFDKYKKSVVEAFKKGELSADEARELIGKSMSGMSRDSQKTFMEDLPNDIKNGLDPKQYETFGQKFSKFFSGLWSGIKSGAGKAFDFVKKKLGFAKGGIVTGDSVHGFAKGGIVYPKLKYCASGAIINQPGRGVPITQAIGGERGQEGILPLTDSQQMDALGQAIARHMTINLTNVNQMNGRVLSRELKKINAQQEFVTNS